jgi:hypothetical protein
MSGRNPFAFLGRRRFLKWGLGAGGVALGGGTAWLSLFGIAPAAGDLRVLSNREHRTLRNLSTTILGPYRIRMRESIADAFDGFLADEPENIVSDLKNALTFMELGPVLFDHRWAIFSDLSQTEREAHLRSWMESDDLTRRMVATAFRKFINLVAHDDPILWAEIHYPGPATGLRET